MKRQAFQKEVSQLKDKLYRMAFLMLLNEEDAADLTQDALLILLKNRERLRKVKNLEAYAIRVIQNLCKDFHKRQNLYKDQIIPQLKDATFFTFQNYESEEALNILFSSLQKMDVKHRLIFEMKTIEGYSYSEISELTGYTPENLRKIVSRVRKGLRIHFSQQYNHG